MMTDPLNLSFKAGPATLDLNALRRWFKEAPVSRVAYRVLKVFNDHGVKNTQIQRLVPQITLDRVCSPEALLPALTNDVLTKTAKTLGIERAGLDGVQERIYRHHSSYQHAAPFFDVLTSKESAVAREREEPETVICWMKHMKMEELARDYREGRDRGSP